MRAMQIIPAIDIKDGHCVRLKQGDMHAVTVFSEDPAAMAQHWLELGATRLHLVDLNGAVAGKPRNELAIREVVSVIGEEIPVQLGGGIRDLDTIEIANAAAQLDRDLLADHTYDLPNGELVSRLAGDCAVQVDEVKPRSTQLQPVLRHCGG